MTTAQLTATRNLWTAVTAPKTEKTAAEMALTSHKLSRDGMKATTRDGQVWYWVGSTGRWTR